jgi:hypothetical protein
MKAKLLFAIFSILILHNSYSQNPTPPCGNDFGTPANAQNIEQQMRYGTVSDAINAIYAAKNTRGYELGCPQKALNYNPPDTTEPLLTDIVQIWSNVHAPQISSYILGCPKIGRYENNAALGAYYAMLAGYFNDTSVLADIGEMMEAQQYSPANVSQSFVAPAGIYGYINVPAANPCNPGGVVGGSVSTVCNNFPQYCITYDKGIFSGENFLIADQIDSANFFDGGAAYDHGWTGVQMIEAAIQQMNPALKTKFKNSAILATNWAVSEHPVRNHNYTAKLIWLLAEMYLWTGDSTYKNALIYKLEKNLLPGILMDMDNDSMVDGTSPPVAFSDLNTIAQIPGRMWDGHNALPWYSGMNAWALTEAYVALRDRGDTTEANDLKPYMLAMIDNLAWEINNLGVITPNQLGVRDLTYALLTGIWKVVMYEAESHPDWYSAVWAMWNSGYFNNYDTHSVCVGLYLLIKSGTPYVPLFIRDPFTTSVQEWEPANVMIFPNPSSSQITLKTNNFLNNATLTVDNIFGQTVKQIKNINGQTVTFSCDNLANGLYFVRLIEDNKTLKTERLIIID